MTNIRIGAWLYSKCDEVAWFLGPLASLRRSCDDFELGEGPELGVFGSDGTRAFAVIDHNSSFAVANAVPEPSSITLLAMAGLAVSFRRRRR